MNSTVTHEEALRRLLAATKLIDYADCKDETVWQALAAAQGTAEGVLRDGRDKVLLADEVIAALDALHEGCNEQSWTGWQNGNGEEVGDRLERAVHAYKAAPALRDGEKQEPAINAIDALTKYSGASIANTYWMEQEDFYLADEVKNALATASAPSLQAGVAAPKQPEPEMREFLRDALASALTGYMREDDLYPASDCGDLLDELCDIAIATLGPFAAPQPAAAPSGDVEQIAKKMAVHAGWNAWDTAKHCGHTLSGNEPEDERNFYRELARIAITATKDKPCQS